MQKGDDSSLNDNSAAQTLPRIAIAEETRRNAANLADIGHEEKDLVLTQMQASLEPLHLIVAGVLFFNLSWLTARRWLALGVIALSAAEVAPLLPWTQLLHTLVTTTQIQLLDTFISAAASGATQACTLLLNTGLAVVLWFSIRALQRWARATVERNEAAFLMLVERDADDRGASSNEA